MLKQFCLIRQRKVGTLYLSSYSHVQTHAHTQAWAHMHRHTQPYFLRTFLLWMLPGFWTLFLDSKVSISLVTWIGDEGGRAGSVLQLTLRSPSAPFFSSSQTNIGTVHVHTIHLELDHGYCSRGVVPCIPLTARRFYPSSCSLVFCLYLISLNESPLSTLSLESVLLVLILQSPSQILCYTGPHKLIYQLSTLIFPPDTPSAPYPSHSAELTPTSGLWPRDALCLETSSCPVFLHRLIFIVK